MMRQQATGNRQRRKREETEKTERLVRPGKTLGVRALRDVNRYDSASHCSWFSFRTRNDRTRWSHFSLSAKRLLFALYKSRHHGTMIMVSFFRFPLTDLDDLFTEIDNPNPFIEQKEGLIDEGDDLLRCIDDGGLPLHPACLRNLSLQIIRRLHVLISQSC